MIDVIILAGGLGTRLRDTVPDLPKPLAPINGRPFLDILLNQIKPLPISKTILAIGYRATQIIDYYKSSSLEFSIEDTPLGTGGALKKALEKSVAPYLLVMNGDSYLDFSLQALLQKNADLVIACREVENASRYGKIKIEANGRISSFSEKSPIQEKGIINGGIYLMKRNLLDAFEGVFSLEQDVFPKILEKDVYATLCHGKFIDIGTKDSFFEAQTLLS